MSEFVIYIFFVLNASLRDKIDVNGMKKSVGEFERILQKGANLIVSFPIGRENKIEFNAHRICNLDFVNSYNIEKFDSKMIIYKVYYSSSPKRFLKDILSYDISIDTSSSNWKIK